MKKFVAILVALLYSAVVFCAEIDEINKKVENAREILLNGDASGVELAKNVAQEAENAFSGENLASAECYLMLGEYYERESSRKFASEFYEKACIAFKKIGGQEEKLANAALGAGKCFRIMSNYEKAQEFLFLAEKNVKDPLVLCEVCKELGNTLGRTGDREQQVLYLLKAKEIIEENGGNSQEIVTIDNNLGVAYDFMGDSQKAILYFEEALSILEREGDGNSSGFVTRLANLGIMHAKSGDYEKALECVERGISIVAEGNFEDAESLNYVCNRALGFISEYQGNYEQATKYYEVALTNCRNSYGRNHPWTAESYLNIADAQRNMKNFGDAQKNAQTSLEIYTKIYGTDSPNLCATLRCMAQIFVAMGDFKNSKKLFEQDLKLKEKSSEYGGILRDCWQNVREMKNDFAQWSKILDSSIQTATNAVEKARTSSAVGSIKNEILAKTAPFYYAGIDIELAKKKSDLKKAFGYSEALRSRGFLDQVGTEAALNLPEISISDAEEIRTLDAKIAYAREELSGMMTSENRDAQKITTLTKEIEKNTKSLAKIEKKLATQSPKFAQLRNPTPATLKDAQKFCADDQAIVEFVLWNEIFSSEIDKSLKNIKTLDALKLNSYALVITKKKSFAVSLSDFDYEEAVNSIRNKITTLCNEAEFESERNSLYENLFGAIVNQLPKNIKSLLIVPDGSLAFLPFDILRADENSMELGAQFEVVFSPSVSISILKKTQEISKSNDGKMLAMGGGWYNITQSVAEHRGNYSGVARDVSTRGIGGGKKKKSVSETSKLSEAQLRNYIREKGAGAYFRDIRLTWDDLPGTLEEVKSLEEAASSALINLIEQENVTESRVKELSATGDLEKYTQLHFACHGYFDNRIPEMCGVVFSEVSQNDSDEDGYLTVPEILRLNLASDFVCLSACETGLGRLKVGDGLTGLSRAFMVSGSKKVGVTLWCVDDEATCEFMIQMYKRVKDGTPYAKAYYDVRKHFREGSNEAWRHPYYRSAFVLYE